MRNEQIAANTRDKDTDNNSEVMTNFPSWPGVDPRFEDEGENEDQRTSAAAGGAGAKEPLVTTSGSGDLHDSETDEHLDPLLCFNQSSADATADADADAATDGYVSSIASNTDYVGFPKGKNSIEGLYDLDLSGHSLDINMEPSLFTPVNVNIEQQLHANDHHTNDALSVSSGYIQDIIGKHEIDNCLADESQTQPQDEDNHQKNSGKNQHNLQKDKETDHDLQTPRTMNTLNTNTNTNSHTDDHTVNISRKEHVTPTNSIHESHLSPSSHSQSTSVYGQQDLLQGRLPHDVLRGCDVGSLPKIVSSGNDEKNSNGDDKNKDSTTLPSLTMSMKQETNVTAEPTNVTSDPDQHDPFSRSALVSDSGTSMTGGTSTARNDNANGNGSGKGPQSSSDYTFYKSNVPKTFQFETPNYVEGNVNASNNMNLNGSQSQAQLQSQSQSQSGFSNGMNMNDSMNMNSNTNPTPFVPSQQQQQEQQQQQQPQPPLRQRQRRRGSMMQSFDVNVNTNVNSNNNISTPTNSSNDTNNANYDTNNANSSQMAPPGIMNEDEMRKMHEKAFKDNPFNVLLNSNIATRRQSNYHQNQQMQRQMQQQQQRNQPRGRRSSMPLMGGGSFGTGGMQGQGQMQGGMQQQQQWDQDSGSAYSYTGDNGEMQDVMGTGGMFNSNRQPERRFTMPAFSSSMDNNYNSQGGAGGGLGPGPGPDGIDNQMSGGGQNFMDNQIRFGQTNMQTGAMDQAGFVDAMDGGGMMFQSDMGAGGSGFTRKRQDRRFTMPAAFSSSMENNNGQGMMQEHQHQNQFHVQNMNSLKSQAPQRRRQARRFSNDSLSSSVHDHVAHANSMVQQQAQAIQQRQARRFSNDAVPTSIHTNNTYGNPFPRSSRRFSNESHSSMMHEHSHNGNAQMQNQFNMGQQVGMNVNVNGVNVNSGVNGGGFPHQKQARRFSMPSFSSTPQDHNHMNNANNGTHHMNHSHLNPNSSSLLLPLAAVNNQLSFQPSTQDPNRGPVGENSMSGLSDPSQNLSPVAAFDKRAKNSIIDLSDRDLATDFSFAVLTEVEPCSFGKQDRTGKRRTLPLGFQGLACRHCRGLSKIGGRLFPSTIKTMSDTNKTLLAMYNHLIKCPLCPSAKKNHLQYLKHGHEEERKNKKYGSQKALFSKIWERLHGECPKA